MAVMRAALLLLVAGAGLASAACPAGAITPAGLFSGNALEGAASDWTMVYSLDLPAFPLPANTPFSYASTTAVPDGTFTRAAYLMVLDSTWVWVSFPWAHSAGSLAIPMTEAEVLGRGLALTDKVPNVNIRSCKDGVPTGDNKLGRMEMFPHCYLQGPGSNKYDAYDVKHPTAVPFCFGSFQFHEINPNDDVSAIFASNVAAGNTLFAYNRWARNDATQCDAGIGNNPNGADRRRDWTTESNANSFTTRRLFAFVNVAEISPTDPPADETTAVPETTAAADDETTPAPDDETTPAQDDETTPAPDDETTPAQDDETTPASDDETTPASDDETTPASDDETTPASDDETTTAADDETTTAADDETTTAADDETTTAPDDETTTAPDDETTTADDQVSTSSPTSLPEESTSTYEQSTSTGSTATSTYPGDASTSTDYFSTSEAATTTAAETTTEEEETSTPDETTDLFIDPCATIDVFFVLDTSGSSVYVFPHFKTLMMQLVDFMRISPDHVRVSTVAFDNAPRTEIDFSTGEEKYSLKMALNALQYPNTNIDENLGRAVRYIRLIIEGASAGHRGGKTVAMFFIEEEATGYLYTYLEKQTALLHALPNVKVVVFAAGLKANSPTAGLLKGDDGVVFYVPSVKEAVVDHSFADNTIHQIICQAALDFFEYTLAVSGSSFQIFGVSAPAAVVWPTVAVCCLLVVLVVAFVVRQRRLRRRQSDRLTHGRELGINLAKQVLEPQGHPSVQMEWDAEY